MKRRDWIFLGVAAAMVAAIWYFFLRRSSPASAASMASVKASPTQDHMIGSSQVIPDARGFAYPIY